MEIRTEDRSFSLDALQSPLVDTLITIVLVNLCTFDVLCFFHQVLESGVLKYLSALLGRTVTIRFPAISGRLDTWHAAHTFEPDEIPHAIPFVMKRDQVCQKFLHENHVSSLLCWQCLNIIHLTMIPPHLVFDWQSYPLR